MGDYDELEGHDPAAEEALVTREVKTADKGSGPAPAEKSDSPKSGS